MIYISPLNTRRLSCTMRELSIGDAITLCRAPATLHEANTTALIRAITNPVDVPLPGQITDPRKMTVQERAMIVAHYIAHIGDNPDFKIGDRGSLSSYLLDGSGEPPAAAAMGAVAGDVWDCQPLLGAHAEAIESLIQQERLPAERHGWWLGAMACQLLRNGEQPIELNAMPDEIERRIAERADVYLNYPESDFMALLMAFIAAVRSLDHLFALDFADDGIVFQPRQEAPGLPPARFPVSDAISEGTIQVFGSTD